MRLETRNKPLILPPPRDQVTVALVLSRTGHHKGGKEDTGIRYAEDI